MKLLRTTGFFHGSALLFSAMVGAGIFVSPKGALKYSSLNIPVSLSIWVGCALLSMMNALCLAELGTTFPVSGASYYFLKRSLGYSVAFLSLWIKTFTHFLGTGAQSLLIASYLIQPFYSGCPAPEVPKKCLALAVLWFFGILNARGMKTVARFQTVTSLMKIFILCLISLTGVVLLVIGKKENVSRFENALDAELPDTSQIAEAILQVYFSYIGSSLLINIVGNWSGEFDTTMEQLRVAIVTVNSTRVDAGPATGLSTWIAAAMNHLKEWAGMGALAGLLVLVSLVCLWYRCKIRVSQQCDAAMITQAFTAIETGHSPQAWLDTIKS